MKISRSLILLALSCVAAFAAEPAPSLCVNGIVTIFGDRRVVFEIYPAGGGESSCMLAEGEASGGIRLLSVDVDAGLACFNNHGQIQKITICTAPDLAAAPAPKSGAGSDLHNPGTPSNVPSTSQASGQSATRAFIADASNLNQSRMGYGLQRSNANQPPPDNDPGSNTADERDTPFVNAPITNRQPPSDTASPSSKDTPWWYRASQATEAARVATADAVLREEAPPYPLTPLTPADTDSRLVGTTAVYFNHFNRHF